MSDDTLTIGGRSFGRASSSGPGSTRTSRRPAGGAARVGREVVTVAVRRVDLRQSAPGRCSGCSARRASRSSPTPPAATPPTTPIRCARLAREAAETDLVKLEVIGDPKTLFPDTDALVKARRCSCRGLLRAALHQRRPHRGPQARRRRVPRVMPLGAPIGSGLGIRNPYNLRILMETVNVPVIVDAGVGHRQRRRRGDGARRRRRADEHRHRPREGPRADGHGDAPRRGGRAPAFRAGRMAPKLYANASSPLTGTIAPSAAPLSIE
jgi:thiazole synthase